MVGGGDSGRPRSAPLLTDAGGKWKLTHFWLGGNCRDPFCVFGWKWDLTAAAPLLTPGTTPPAPPPPPSVIESHTPRPPLDRLGYLSEHTGTSVFNPPPAVVALGAEECCRITTGARPPAPAPPAPVPQRPSSKPDVGMFVRGRVHARWLEQPQPPG